MPWEYHFIKSCLNKNLQFKIVNKKFKIRYIQVDSKKLLRTCVIFINTFKIYLVSMQFFKCFNKYKFR